MKKIFILLVCCLAFPSFAQKPFIKELFLGGVMKKRFDKSTAPVLRTVQGKKILDTPSKIPNMQELDRYIFSNAVVSSLTKEAFRLEEINSSEMMDARNQYKAIMEDMRQFKKEMDIWLYYQSKSGEKHPVSAAERAALGKQIIAMKAKLAVLEQYISPQNESYRAACEYILYVSQQINPMLRGMLKEYSLSPSVREYDMEEFFLHTPPNAKETGFWEKTLHLLKGVSSAKMPKQLPRGLRMAILNDNQSFLNQIPLEQKKSFVPDWQIETYDNVQDLLSAVRTGKKFDIVLTDLVVPGGGGLDLTPSLREEGFKGVILALSAFKEDNRMGEIMFQMGFDGMLSLPIKFYKKSTWPETVMQKMKNYFYYRNLHNWTR